MSDVIEKLKKQYAPENRYSVFGEILLSLAIQGIKGTNCSVSFDFPVTAISGYNGAGKSTIAQIALCMYKSSDARDEKRKYLKDFFVKTLLDKQPYDADARIKATYANADSDVFQYSLLDEDDRRKKENSVYYSTDRWAGYKRQPQRTVYYYGMSYFIPYQEQNSNLLRDNNASIKTTDSFDERIVKRVAEILSIAYTDLQNNRVVNETREERVISASMRSITYSENHMGCGEGRLLKLVNALETAPQKSLFVIEEPETALHQLAQYNLGKYFLDVCERKKHQIIFTTHSPEIQKALPVEARKYIKREAGKETVVINNPSVAEIESYFSGGHIQRMTIITEDDVAKTYFEEIINLYEPGLFNSFKVFPLNGGYLEVKEYVHKTRGHELNVFGVVDERRKANGEDYIIGFPEETPPEISFFSDENVRILYSEEFKFDWEALKALDHHEYFETIAKQNNVDAAYVKQYCIRKYVRSRGKDYFSGILGKVSNWLAATDRA